MRNAKQLHEFYTLGFSTYVFITSELISFTQDSAIPPPPPSSERPKTFFDETHWY